MSQEVQFSNHSYMKESYVGLVKGPSQSAGRVASGQEESFSLKFCLSLAFEDQNLTLHASTLKLELRDKLNLRG